MQRIAIPQSQPVPCPADPRPRRQVSTGQRGNCTLVGETEVCQPATSNKSPFPQWAGVPVLREELYLTPLTSDIWGRKPVLLAAAGVFFVGSLVCGASTGIEMLIAGRAVQGMGGGGCIILVNICISDLFSMRYGFFAKGYRGPRLLNWSRDRASYFGTYEGLYLENPYR